ncbi:molybdenum cofactor guanylyltransferase [Calothrix sp. PCC 6303]|uniref:molybdenum cofactor guanylyltransferase n=1 Tax=Calothrix sp. PCC 6303 TaxID=1170562 RepID=UPI0002A01E58|nr:molybdenum cofactor guanylyltransferase [Calothrix sp. PCC 6303]AFZ00154.1 molybdenum cofactor guanylyltransferase [Calothrix sp. PCC 6303]
MEIDSTDGLTKSEEVSLTAIILAGGKSSRMGQDKALMQINGIPLLQKVYEVAASCSQRVLVVTPWQERYQQLLPHTCNFVQEMHISEEFNDIQNHGPLVGFAQALATVETEWVLLLACDLPNLDVQTLKAWANKLTQTEDHFIAALVKHDKGWEPLCGFYRQLCLPHLNEFINQGGRSFQKWLAQNPVAVLPDSVPEIFFNCNTLEDVRKINATKFENK